MKKEGILLAAVVLLSAAGLAQAQSLLFEPTQDDIGVTAGATYVSRYIWRGFDFYPRNHSALQPFVDLDLYGTGWTFGAWWSRPNGADYENFEEIKYTVAYGRTCSPDTPHATSWQLGYMYYNYPDGPARLPATPGSSMMVSQNLDRQEMFASLSWPNAIPVGVVPSYTLIRMWPDESGRQPGSGAPWSGFRQAGGWLHVFGLGYDWRVPGLLPNTPEQIINLSVQTIYNDGTGTARRTRVKHDWSHALLGATTNIDMGSGWSIVPGVWYQSSWDDSVNTSDEYYCSLTGLYRTR